MYAIKPDLSPLRKVREGLADVISNHELLTNLFWDSGNTLASVYKTNTGAVVG